MTETQAQTSTYGEVTQAGIELVRMLGDWGKLWLNSRNQQRRDTKKQLVVTNSNAAPQAASRSVDKAALRLTVPAPAPARASQDAIATATAKAEQARAAEAQFDVRFVAVMERLEQVLAARRAAAPAVIEGQSAPTDAATLTPTCAPPDSSQTRAAPAVVSVSKVAEALPEAASSAPGQHLAQLVANPVAEPPLVEAAHSAVSTASGSPDVAKPEALSDGTVHQAASAEAARTVTTEKTETAPSTPPQTAEPELTPAQRRAKWLIECKDPHVQSWRMIKRFFRRMTDFDLLAFSSSVPMFRAFLAMLRAMTPYYEGPRFSLDELALDGMPLAFAMAEQNA